MLTLKYDHLRRQTVWQKNNSDINRIIKQQQNSNNDDDTTATPATTQYAHDTTLYACITAVLMNMKMHCSDSPSLENVALKKTAVQSGENNSAHMAVDGHFNLSQCATTNVMLRPWWAVDLVTPTIVTHVSVTTCGKAAIYSTVSHSSESENVQNILYSTPTLSGLNLYDW